VESLEELTLGSKHVGSDSHRALVPARKGGQILEDSASAVVGVLNSLMVEIMAPSDALNSVDKEHVVGVQDEVVHESCGVSNLSSSHLVRQSPDALDSDRMAGCDRQPSLKRSQRFGRIASDLHEALDSRRLAI